MKKTIFVLVVFFLFRQATVLIAEDTIPLPPKPPTIQEMLAIIPLQFGQDPKLIGKITWCESHDEVKSHDGGRGLNITGIHDATFDRWLPLYTKERHETLHKDSTMDQIKMMSWAFSKGDAYRNQWTTYVAYMHGGTFTFYSSLLKKTFTVHCT